jgi:lysyl-tRNA synthetase class II
VNYGYARVIELYKQFNKESSERFNLDLHIEYGILEFYIYYEVYESLMDEKTGLSWEQYIL